MSQDSPKVPIKFDIYQGDALVRSELIEESIIKVGKLPSSHLRIDDEHVSRMHAVIEVTGPEEIHIIDLGSASGTVVNGQKVNKAKLQNGDEIVLGETRVLVEVGADLGVGDDDATMAIDRDQAGLDLDSLGVAEHADPSMPDAAPGSVTEQAQPNPFGAQPPAQKGTMLGMPAAQPAASVPPPAAAMPAPAPGSIPPVAPGSMPPVAPGSVPPVAPGSIPPASVPPGMPGPGALPNPFAAPAAAAPAAAAPAPAMTAAAPMDGGEVRYGIVASGPPVSADEVETGDQALEVMIMWGDANVLNVDHLNPVRSYYVGEATDAKGKPATDYLMGSEVLGSDRMPVVLEAGATGAVVIPQGATGEVTVGDQVMTVQELISSGRAQACSEMAGAHQFPLPAGATARIQHRGFTFVTRPTNAGKAVGASGDGFSKMIAAAWMMWIYASLALHGLFLLLMYFMPPSGSSLSLDLLNEDSRLAKYLMEPPETIEEETPDWLQNTNADDEEGGKGKRHKDDEGQMGKEESKKTKNKYGIEGPPDNEDPHMAREKAKEEAATAGILGVLSQSTGAWNSPTSPYGQDTALGYDPMSALGALMGDNIGENFGFGGLGLRGTGRGGGGTGEGTIGLGNIGTIGHGGGGGSGSGYGRGAGGFRGRKARVPKIRSGSADVRGSLSKEVIRRVIRRHINEVRFCYEQELNQRPDLEGRVSIKFIISPSGAVQAANVAGSTIGSSRVEQCVAKAVRRWTFPAPDGGGIVIVTYPFLLQSAGG